MMKTLYHSTVGKVGGSDLARQISFADYINPIDEDMTMSTLIVMDEDIRQNDLQFLQVLNNVTSGSVIENDVRCLASRCFDLLSEEEHNIFSNAIHRVPTWE